MIKKLSIKSSFVLTWLNNRDIRDKLLIFITIPVIAVLFFSSLGISEKYQQYKNNQNTQAFLSIAIKLDNLVHELQKERGISTGLTESNSDFINDISSQRSLTDKAVLRFVEQKQNTNLYFLDNKTQSLLNNIEELLEELPIIRKSTDKNELQKIIDNYSNLNAHIINFIQYLELITNENELARISYAYINLVRLQERAGQERANVVRILSSNFMHTDYFRQVLSLVESQETLIKDYDIKAPLKYRNLLHAKLSEQINSEVDKFRNAATRKIIRNEFLNELQALIGYGGIIHDFKNYLIRGDSNYHEDFLQKKSNVQGLFSRYKKSKSLTQEDLFYINEIEEILNHYFKLVGNIKFHLQQGLSTQEIDAMVKIDDTAALLAMDRLRQNPVELQTSVWWEHATKRIDLVNEVTNMLRAEMMKLATDNTQSEMHLLMTYLLIMSFTLIITFVLGMYLMQRLIGSLKDISGDMERMFVENQFNKPLLISGKDEISVMARTFNKLIGERLKFESQLALSAEVFANTKEAIMIANVNKEIEMTNPAFEEVTGFSEKEVLNENFFSLHQDLLNEDMYEMIWSALECDSHWEGELWNKKPNGESYLIGLRIYIVKNNDGLISHYIGIFSDITQRKQQEEHIWRQANYDALTELPNRNMCMDRLSQFLKNAKRKKTQVAVFFIDLDRFKLINDTLGHNAGDELLRVIANRLKDVTRESDIVSRLGGDEFVILLNDIKNIYSLEKIAEHVLAKISEPVLLNDESETFTSGSIGIALFPDDGKNVETLMKHADTAMYQSKKMGRNYFMFYKQEMNKIVMKHMKIEKELRNAINNQEFCLHYQPVVDLSNGHILGAEALIRWNHPIHGLVGPDKFIQIAEESGLIIPIGEWVITTAAHQAAQWNKNSNQLLKIAVNISSRQCADHGLAIEHFLTKTFVETQLKPGMLEIEITESLLMDGAQKTIESLQKIRNHGIGISLDDFGTGYSSLSYLKHFPISTIKIDRSFVNDVTTNKKDAQLVNAIIMLGKGLDLNVIGEGIERKEHLDFLHQLGCHFGQGYYFSRPLTAEDFSSYLYQHNVISPPPALVAV